jgi:aerobactin synthase
MSSFRRQAEIHLIARALSELCFEGILEAKELAPGSFAVQVGPASYRFQGARGAWGHLRVREEIQRWVDGASASAESAARFFFDAKEAHGMGDITLAHFFEEMQNTLFSDEALRARQAGLTAAELATWPDLDLQEVLNGHPKILLNKGRLGWAASDFEAYAPEHGARFRLQWLAVKKEKAVFSSSLDANALLAECMDSHELARFQAPEGYYVFPAHPWQWNRMIRLHFGSALASGELIHLGEFGDTYSPQVSLRTLSNRSRPGRADIKLPLTILNTSAYRGIAGHYVPGAPALSRRFTALIESDPALANVRLCREIGALSVPQEEYAAIPGAPYRYQELLGAIWREAPSASEREEEESILTAALLHRDKDGDSLARSLMQLSGLSPEAWLRAYFREVVLPLYHLQKKHGIGLVAHGQNIVLRLKNKFPVGITLKDFQGDLRFAEGAYPERDSVIGSAGAHLPRLPAHYLIHDLITGHFVTVLRFFSAALAEDKDPVSEEHFYALLADELTRNGGAPELLRPEFERVLLNKVRFKIGYADSDARPLPALGDPLSNPLAKGLYATS